MERAPRKLWVLLAVGAAAIVISAVGVRAVFSRTRHRVEVAPGKSADTVAGRVTVNGWTPSKDPNSASEASVQSCRIRPGGPIMDLRGFRLQLGDGEQLEPDGSKFGYSEEADCVEATVLFDLKDGARPSAVIFRSGSTDFSWKVSPEPQPARP